MNACNETASPVFLFENFFRLVLYHLLGSKSRLFYLILGRKTFGFFLPKFRLPDDFVPKSVYYSGRG